MLMQSTMPLVGASPSTASLVHPIIQYHFADDSPKDILPRHDGEAVIILDYEPGKVAPLVESASKNIAVTGIKVTDAPPSVRRTTGNRDEMTICSLLRQSADKATKSTLLEHNSFRYADFVLRQGAVATSSSLNDPRLILAQFRER